jgi:hypothetical protein
MRAVLRVRVWSSGALELRDGRLLSWSQDKTLRLWAADGAERAALRGHEGWHGLRRAGAAGRAAALVGKRTLSCLWAADGTEIAILRGHELPVWRRARAAGRAAALVVF